MVLAPVAVVLTQAQNRIIALERAVSMCQSAQTVSVALSHRAPSGASPMHVDWGVTARGG
jgi:hypothetical protein